MQSFEQTMVDRSEKPTKWVVLEERKEVWLRASWETGIAIRNGLFSSQFPGYTVKMCQGYILDRLACDNSLRDRWAMY